METILSILFSGVFNATTLFLIAAGLQVVFGVQKVFNLACGSFYALGAYFGIVVVKSFVAGGFPKPLFIVPLIGAGLLLGFIGPIVERGLIKFVYDRDETFQLLLTFALVMMIEDVIKFIWGTSPQTTGGIDLIYGRLNRFGATLPVYNLVVILCSLIIAALWNDWGYGYVVVIDHGNGWQTLYAHLSSINVGCGQAVYQGGVLGGMGCTGNSSGPHVHFEMMSDTYGKVNPVNFLP